MAQLNTEIKPGEITIDSNSYLLKAHVPCLWAGCIDGQYFYFTIIDQCTLTRMGIWRTNSMKKFYQKEEEVLGK